MSELMNSLMIQAGLSTDEVAIVLKVKPETIRWYYSKNGNYQGLVPRKMPNRRLLWPVSDVEKLLAGESVDAGK